MSPFKKHITAPLRGYTTLTHWYGKSAVNTILLILFIITAVIMYQQSSTPATEAPTPEPTRTTVTLATPESFSRNFTGSLIGTTVAQTEATLLTERGGQVTRVPVTLGQVVSAGTIIAQFENASERAALTQARGALESALANAQQSGISITDAELRVNDIQRAIVAAHNGAYASVTQIITGNIDQFFSNPNTTIPGLRVNGRGNTQTLIQIRKTLRTQLEDWQRNTTTLNANSDPTISLELARNTINNTISMVDIFIANFQQERGDSQYTVEQYREFITSFAQMRTTLNGLLTSFSDLESQLTAAKENVARAQLGGGRESSLASAQITQARGALQAAEANFNKTVIRSPISGTISSLSVRAGDFIGALAPVARITNTDGVEVTTYINKREREYFAIGETVRINNSATGTISAIAPDLDPVTQKIEVRISVNDTSILPGSTVTITLPNAPTNTTMNKDTPITIPITAIKFTDTTGSVFVVENEKLVARPVVLGTVSGSMVTVLEGIDATTPFVVDARGKTAGESVLVITN